MVDVKTRIDGVVIGVLLGFDDGMPLVVFAGNPKDTALKARSLVALGPDAIASEVALLFEGADPSRPLVVGRIVEPTGKTTARTAPDVLRDGERVNITANERIEFRCGKARIVMEKDGRITIRGSYVTSKASVTNRILGGSVNLN